MRILRVSGRVAAPWKNGGGTTTEVAVFPAGASFDDFGWRISIADIARGGPFSQFPGIDRTLNSRRACPALMSTFNSMAPAVNCSAGVVECAVRIAVQSRSSSIAEISTARNPAERRASAPPASVAPTPATVPDAAASEQERGQRAHAPAPR